MNNNHEEENERFRIEPLPKQREFITSTARFACYSGGWGSGKTVAGCLRGLLLSSFPGNFGLIGRLTYRELSDTTRRTFFELCPPEFYDPAQGGEWRRSENHLKLTNGSEIIFRHLDQIAEKELLSLNLGWFYFDQAEEIPEAVFTTLVSRLRLNTVPTRYGFITCNPEPGNWIFHKFKKPFDEGKLDKNHHLVEASTYENKEHLPLDYIQSLEALPEEVQKRFVAGRWDVFEGQIYPEFHRRVHVVQPFAVPDNWEKLVAIDHGMTNPTAALLSAIDYDGNIYIVDEYYSPGIVSDHARAILRMVEGKEIAFWLIDPSTQAKTREKKGMPWSVLEEYEDQGIYATPANNELLGGINRVREFLRVNPKRRHPRTGELGSPRLFIFSNCIHLIDEFPQYQWKKMKNITTRNAMERPREYMDHALDACFTGKTEIFTSKGNVPIKDIRINDLVWTRKGLKSVDAVFSVGVRETLKLKLKNGTELVGTPEHPIWVEDKGFTPLQDIRYGDMIRSCTQTNIDDWLERNGKNTTARFPLNTISIIKMATKLTIKLRTWNVCLVRNTKDCIGNLNQLLKRSVNIVGRFLRLNNLGKNFVLTTANQHGGVQQAKTMNKGVVLNVAENSGLINTKERIIAQNIAMRDNMFVKKSKQIASSVRLSSQQKTKELSGVAIAVDSVTIGKKEKVYNLTISSPEEYFANGILVHNCRYTIMSRFPAPSRIVRGTEIVTSWQRQNANQMAKELPKDYQGDSILGKYDSLPVEINTEL